MVPNHDKLQISRSVHSRSTSHAMSRSPIYVEHMFRANDWNYRFHHKQFERSGDLISRTYKHVHTCPVHFQKPHQSDLLADVLCKFVYCQWQILRQCQILSPYAREPHRLSLYQSLLCFISSLLCTCYLNKQVNPVDSDPFAQIRCACLCRISHCYKVDNRVYHTVSLCDDGEIRTFLKKAFLHWLNTFAHILHAGFLAPHHSNTIQRTRPELHPITSPFLTIDVLGQYSGEAREQPPTIGGEGHWPDWIGVALQRPP